MKGMYLGTDGSVRKVDIEGWRDISPLIGGDMFDIVRLEDKADMYIDDEGVLTDRTPNYMATLLAIEKGTLTTIIRGDAVVFGTDGNGSTTDAPEWVYEWAEEVKRQTEPPEFHDATRN